MTNPSVMEIDELVESLDRRQAAGLWIQLRERYSKDEHGTPICTFCSGKSLTSDIVILEHQPQCIVPLLSKRIAKLDRRI